MATPGKAVSASNQTDTESLPTLIGRLSEDVIQLLDTKLSLLKVEIKEDVRAVAQAGSMVAIGGIVAAIGFALVNVAVAFGVATLFAGANLSQPAQYALGFVITGFFYLVIGVLVVSVMKNRLARVEVVPERTLEELRKDKQWLKNEL